MAKPIASFFSRPAVLPRLRYCPFADLTIRTRDGFGVRLGRGAAVDFAQVVGQTRDGRPVTLEAALGELAAAFSLTPLAAPPAAPPPVPEPLDDEVS